MAVHVTEHFSPTDIFEVEGELLDQEAGPTAQEPDQLLSEEHNYRERVSGVRSYMGWHQIPELNHNHHWLMTTKASTNW